MDDVFVAQLMTSPVKTVPEDTLVEDAANEMLADGIGSLIVVDDDDHLAGILTSTDFVRIVAERKPKDQTPVAEYMTADVMTASAQDPVQEVADRMIEHGIHHMPVVEEDGSVMGIVTTTDLTAYVSQVQSPTPS
jgi:CBS domain-containing protein